MKNKVRFKYDPKRRQIAKLIGRSPKMRGSKMTGSMVVDRPDEVPESAVRPGTYLIRYGKGKAYEFEYVEEFNEWYKKGSVEAMSERYYHWLTLPYVTQEQLKAMNEVRYMLTNHWQTALMAYNRMDMQRQFEFTMFRASKLRGSRKRPVGVKIRDWLRSSIG